MRKGEILVDDVRRVFRVHTHQSQTLKDLFVLRRREPAREVVALDGVTFHVDVGEAIGLVGRNGSGKSTLLRLLSGIIKPTSGNVAVEGRIGSLLELGAGFHPELTGRENVYLNGSIHGLSRTRVRELMDEIVDFAGLEDAIDLPVRTYSSGMYMRLGFAVAAHIQSDVLLLDEVFAVGDEGFQRKCFGKIAEFKQRGGTIVFVSHDAQAVERLCDRAVLLRHGRVDFDGPVHDAIGRYHALLAAEESPDELAAGLREFGTGDARIVEGTLIDSDGDERLQFTAGEPLTVRLRVAVERPIEAPVVVLELRDDNGVLLASGEQDTEPLGWRGEPGERLLELALHRLPLADGRFHLRFALREPTGGRLLHLLDDALQFVVYPPGSERGPVLLDGEWSLKEIEAQAETPSR